jgi:hypothetical protein
MGGWNLVVSQTSSSQSTAYFGSMLATTPIPGSYLAGQMRCDASPPEVHPNIDERKICH